MITAAAAAAFLDTVCHGPSRCGLRSTPSLPRCALYDAIMASLKVLYDFIESFI
jgi:hypothetical protein